MDNLKIYKSVCDVPAEAIKTISSGRLKGFFDINPMWRIKKLTEMFGPCGVGWKYEILKQWTENGANGEISAFCNINLYYRYDDQWSEPIPGTGGAAFVSREQKGLHTSDECFKMALTDAISVAAKFIGVGGNVYWERDPDKYTYRSGENQPSPQKEYICEECGKPIKPFKTLKGEIIGVEALVANTKARYKKALCAECSVKAKAEKLKDGN